MDIEQAVQFQKDVAADVAAESDAALRSWYEQEIELTPDFRASSQAVRQLGELSAGIAQLIEHKSNLTSPEASQTEVPSVIEAAAEEDEIYVSPEERTRRSVVSWLEDVTATYRSDMAAANQIEKRSKREHAKAIAQRQFGRQFEFFGDDQQHILHDTAATAAVVEEMARTNSPLFSAFGENAKRYAKESGISVLSDSGRLADMIKLSANHDHVGDFMELMLYECLPDPKKIDDVLKVDWYFADAGLDILPYGYDAIIKVVDISEYNLNRNIKDGQLDGAAAARFQTHVAQMVVDGDFPGIVRIAEARAVIASMSGQILARRRHSLFSDDTDRGEYEANVRSVLADHVDPRELFKVVDAVFAYLDQTIAYDQIKVHGLDGNDLDLALEEMPKEVQDIVKLDPLYQKRMEYLTPLAYSMTLSRAIVKSTPNIFDVQAEYTICHVPFSVDRVVSITLPQLGGEQAGHNELHSQALYEFHEHYSDFVQNDTSFIDEDGAIHLYFTIGNLTTPQGQEVPFHALVRPATPADLETNGQLLQMDYPIKRIFSDEDEIDSIETYSSLYETFSVVREKILAERSRFVGRRPIRFRFPSDWQTKGGLQTVEVRQHEDHLRTIATIKHDKGEIELFYDDKLEPMDSRRVKTGHSDEILSWTGLVLQTAIMKMLAEWSTKPSINTSEGTISLNETAKVNMGHFSYLPIIDGKKHRFTPKQAAACKREQGLNLALESERRKAMDPTGQGRNSTYHRESFDPSKPPLDIHYDESILTI